MIGIGSGATKHDRDIPSSYITTLKNSQEKWTVSRLLTEQQTVLQAMPSVLLALKLGVLFGASTENSFSTLKNILSDHRWTITCPFNVTRKLRTEWKDIIVLQKFCTKAGDSSSSNGELINQLISMHLGKISILL